MATTEEMQAAAARRARLVELISTTRTPTVRGLAPLVGVTHKTISTDLRLLRDAGAVEWDEDPSGRIRQGTLRVAPPRDAAPTAD